MVRRFVLSTFFRQTPNRLLQEYFLRRQLLAHVPWDSMKQTRLEPLMAEWGKLEADVRAVCERDFQLVSMIATQEATRTMMEQAPHYHESLKGFGNHYGRAMWLFLKPDPEAQKLLRRVQHFAVAHEENCTEARRLKGLFSNVVRTDENACEDLASAIRAVYLKQGRGDRCRVDHDFRERPLRHYYVAYPEDYTSNDMLYRQEDLVSSEVRPVFHVTFIYHPERGILETSAPAPIQEIRALQDAFCRTILERNLSSAEHSRAMPDRFELNRVKDWNRPLPPSTDPRVIRLSIAELKLELAVAPHKSVTVSSRGDDFMEWFREIVNLRRTPLELLNVVGLELRAEIAVASPPGSRRYTIVVSRQGMRGCADPEHAALLEDYITRWLQ